MVVSEFGASEADQCFKALLSCLSHPPLFTCLRANTHIYTLQETHHSLLQHLEQMKGRSPAVLTHPQLPDVLLLPVSGPRRVSPLDSEVIVDSQCGSAVLRGAHVFNPGILSTPKFMKVGDVVSVFSDVEGKCTRGAKEFRGKKVFLGNGVSEVDRAQIFCSEGPVKGLGIRMTEPLYQSPSFDGVLKDQLFLQGSVVALEKVRSKMEKIKENAKMLKLDCIKAYCINSINAVSSDIRQENTEGPPFPEESFDRVLLDAPCSSLGQRPMMSYGYSLKEVCSYQLLQRKLFTTAVRLLKSGGVLVYSTCTVTLAENEEQVSWALQTFPCLTLEPQVPHLGSEGMLGAGLSHEQRRLLQRFRPELSWKAEGGTQPPDANTDTIGFFIAKFSKR
ncbi:hypothetical protein DNTS_027461 [Danionella cerebrum]|uniref:SAM-dependent MTase RsmB/NOP-type domain-containing protein n=1 Tax=Danionella cerebrum TaxID=2873325 RepID=A0A553N0B2_9TELE|nr:hypothetical protein DNTS_027461 [Danionella translucida]